ERVEIPLGGQGLGHLEDGAELVDAPQKRRVVPPRQWPTQARPHSLWVKCEGGRPVARSKASSHSASTGLSRMRSASKGPGNQTPAFISSSSCPGPQPA